MKARKLDLRPYQVRIRTNDGDKMVPYDVRDSLADILTAPVLRLNGPKLLKNNALATEILSCKDDEILIDGTKWDVLRDAVQKIEGFTGNDTEFVRRILDAPEVDVEEKKEGGP